jgi:hypothetical protein
VQDARPAGAGEAQAVAVEGAQRREAKAEEHGGEPGDRVTADEHHQGTRPDDQRCLP